MTYFMTVLHSCASYKVRQVVNLINDRQPPSDRLNTMFMSYYLLLDGGCRLKLYIFQEQRRN